MHDPLRRQAAAYRGDQRGIDWDFAWTPSRGTSLGDTDSPGRHIDERPFTVRLFDTSGFPVGNGLEVLERLGIVVDDQAMADPVAFDRH
jgi:hypothetical protein